MTLSNHTPIPELYVSAKTAEKLKHAAGALPSWDMSPRQVCDLELLMNGGFYPLKGFHTEADYKGVVENMRTADGTLWPIPITLDVSEKFAETVAPGAEIALRDAEGVILAIMTVTDKYLPNKPREAEMVFGADDLAHPAVNYLHNTAGTVYLGGPVKGLQAPVHYDFRSRRDTPNELRAYFKKLGWSKIVAFQTRISSSTRRVCSAGVEVTARAPWAMKESRKRGFSAALAISWFRRCNTAAGVPAGAATPHQ